MIPRRRFLALAATPATMAAVTDGLAARHLDRTASAYSPQNREASVDPQIERLRAIELDETVEPALVFLPGGD